MRLVHQAYRDAKVFDRDQSLAENVTKLAKLPLAHHPGEVWEYSVAVDVLGRVIEVVSGKELDQFIAERITQPLGMAAADFYVHEQDLGRLAEAQPGADGNRQRCRMSGTSRACFPAAAAWLPLRPIICGSVACY